MWRSVFIEKNITLLKDFFYVKKIFLSVNKIRSTRKLTLTFAKIGKVGGHIANGLVFKTLGLKKRHFSGKAF